MKVLVVLLVLVGFIGSFALTNSAYGLWVSQSPQELMEQSETVFVGTIQSVNVLEFERSNEYHVQENGVSKIIVENYTQTLDEYTVSIEEFLKNPQESNTITMLEATVGGVPGRSVSIGGFELGDRVLFYVPKIDGTNQYAPESFKIPKECDASDVLKQPRIDGFNNFYMMQDGVEMDDNFTANIPIQFSYDRDVGTLFGQSFDVSVGISKVTDNKIKNVFQKQIQVNVEPCEWIGSAKWDFVPTKGNYRMGMNVLEDTGGTSSNISFSVFDYLGEIMSPLKQIQSGVSPSEIQCKEPLILIQKYDGSPACVTESTKQKLIERGWTGLTSTEESLLERYSILPEVVVFYETYPDAAVSVKNDHVSYFAGSDDDYFVRMNLMFDENQSIKDIDFHCYYQRVHQYELPQEDIASKISKYDCIEHGKKVDSDSTLKQQCADNYKLLRDKIHDLQTTDYSSATVYVDYLDSALDIKNKIYQLECESITIEWFHLITGNEITNPTQMQIESTYDAVRKITNHDIVRPKHAVGMKIAAELEQRNIEYKIIPYDLTQTDEGWRDPARLCSTLSFDNGTKFYASAVFHPEPIEIIGVFVNLEKPDDCQKYHDLPT